MRQRRASGLRKPARRAPLIGAVLTLYSTWPCAQPLPANPALSLALSREIAHAVGAYTHTGEPLALALTVELSPGTPPASASAPLVLELAMVLRRAPGDAVQSVEVDTVQPAFYSIRLNGQDLGVARLLRLPDGRWLVRRADLQTWRLRLPPGPPVLFRDEEHYPLDAFKLVAYRVNELRQELDLEVAPRYFADTLVDPWRSATPAPVLPTPGGFVNYDVFFSASSDVRRLDALLETAFFNRLGVGTSGFVAQDMASDPRLVRLETAWRRDYPGEMKSLIIGDAIGASGLWGRPVRFGGVSYGTNFSTNPGFVTFPLPGLTGEAILPTTTELYVDGVLRQSARVPPGPFRIDNVPVVTGQGEVRMVVRDLLGREQVVTVPYYASQQLLRKGLVEEAYQIGAIRENFGVHSHDYGRALAAAQYRKGLSDTLTAEVRGEVLRDQQTAGAGASIAFPRIGILSGAAAVSHGPDGGGALAFAGFERQTVRGVSFGVRSEWNTREFTQLGLQPGQRAPVRLLSGNLGYSPPGLGSFGLAYVRQDSRDQPDVEIASASYTVSLTRSSALILFALKPLSGEQGTSVGATFSIALGDRTSASLGFSMQPGSDPVVAQVQQNLPPGRGTGYRVLAGTGNGGRQEAGFAFQTDSGTYLVEVGRADDLTGVRANASGAVAMLGGRPFLARTLNESFAVAHVPGFSDVGIHVNNQLVARTDSAGYALLPRLLPYQPNPVRIDTADLPLDTRIDAAQLDAVPYYRSGLFLEFPVARADGAVLELRLSDGGPMPVGSTVQIVGRAERFPVAERGEAYVTGLTPKTRLRATWRNQNCELDVEVGPLGRQPHVGPLVCAGVQR